MYPPLFEERMSQPIELYNINGELVVMYSPKVAEELVERGELFISPPLVEVEEQPKRKRVSQEKK